MEPSRREFTKIASILAATGLAGCPSNSNTTPSSKTSTTPTDTSDPIPPATCLRSSEQPSDPIFEEAYGELILTDRFTSSQYCIWRVFSSDCFELSYEARVTGPDNGELDILVMPAEEGQSFRDKMHSDGIRDRASDKLTNIEDFNESLTSRNLRHRYSTEGLNTKTATLSPGEYYVVFDRSDVATTQTGEYVSAQVAIWARKLVDEKVEEEARNMLSRFYTSLSADTQNTIQLLDGLAEAICQSISLDYSAADIENMSDAPVKTYQATATVDNLLDLLNAKTGFQSALLNETTSTATTWTNRGATLIPILGSLLEVVDAACTVADQQSVPSVNQVQEFLLKLVVLLAELVLARFGVTRKFSRLIVSALDRYLLGYLKEAMSLEMYIFLLRELFILIPGITNIVGEIQKITDEVADLNDDFFSKEEKGVIESMDNEDDLLDIGFLDDHGECSST